MPFAFKDKSSLMNIALLLMVLLVSTTSLSFGILFVIDPPYIFIALFILLLFSSSLSVIAYHYLREMVYGLDPEDELRQLKGELEKTKLMKKAALKKYYGKELDSELLKKLGKEYEETIIEKEVLINLVLERSYVDLVSAIIKKYMSVMGKEAIEIAKKTGIDVSYAGEFTGRANKETISKLLVEYERAKGTIAISLAREVAKKILDKNPNLDVPEELSPTTVFLKKL